MIKLSIITINYNDANGLKKTIDSVVNQSFTNFEYIIIDGGSTDGSKNVIEAYQTSISYWVSEKDTGRYNAMNKGILKAQGEYCLFLNSGDILADNTVLQKVFVNPINADIIYGNMNIDWGNNKITLGKMPQVISFEHMYHDTLWHPVSFIKKELFNKYGLYNEAYKIVADYDFFFNVIIMKMVSLEKIEVTISQYNVNGISSLPENKLQEKQERINVIKSYLPLSVIEFIDKHSKKTEINETLFSKIKSILK